MMGRMNEAFNPRRFQFSLRTLFWLTLVVALLLLAMNERRKRIQVEAELRREVMNHRFTTLSLKVERAETEVMNRKIGELLRNAELKEKPK
jgi:hypothetical protein